MKSALSAFLFAVLLFPGIPSAAPQLDIPDRGARRGADAEDGVEVPRRTSGDLAPKREADTRSPLDLGAGARPAPAKPLTPDRPATGVAAPAAGSASLPPSVEPGLPSVAGAILDELRAIEDPDDPRVTELALRLIEQGPGGVSAARGALFTEGPGLILGGAQVLLSTGEPADVDQVVGRLSRRLPPRAGPALLSLLFERAPVRASPELLIELFEHPQGVVRDAAARRLPERLTAEQVPLLAARLRSRSTETRTLSLEALARIDDDGARNLLADRLADSSAKVAVLAARLLALDDAYEPQLLDLAFPAAATPGGPDRATCYARLAVIEREDRRGLTLVAPERAPTLLAELTREDPLVRGTAALLLAGVGFRAEGSRGFAWLDRQVPHEIVRMLAGDVFHRDFSSLAEPAQRRMTLLSGRTFGHDGAAWQAWWIDSIEGFRAHRAVLEVGVADVPTLSVRYKSAGTSGTVLRFLGPEAPGPAADGSAPVLGRTIFLTAAQMDDLSRRLADEGVYRADRLPSPTVAFTASERELEVRVREQSKRFVLPAKSRDEDAWLNRLALTFEALDEANRWQRFPGARTHRALFEDEAGWWAEPHSQVQRDARLKGLVLADLDALAPFERGPGLNELARLAARGALDALDFQPLVELLSDETYYGERVPRLVDLLVECGTSAGGDLPPELATRLTHLLAESYPAEAVEDVVRVLGRTDPAVTRAAARDESPLLRALAAAGLARRATDEDRALLRELLSDPSPDVEAAAVLAHAEAGITDASEELLFRARMSEPRVRSAALRAIGILRLPGAADALVQALVDPSQGVQVSAAEGLADLADPNTAPLLVSLLARGRRAPHFEPARRGLRALGPAAHPALLRAAGSVSGAAARDAALLLSEDLVAEAAPILMRLLSANPDDARLASELCILTVVDMRGEEDPPAAWAGWWSTVRRDDPLAWFRAECERLGRSAPPAADFEGAGTLEARLFLTDLLPGEENHVVERARRELGRMLGGDLGKLPMRGAMRAAFVEDLRSRLTAEALGEAGG